MAEREIFRPVLSRYSQATTRREEKRLFISQNITVAAKREGKPPISYRYAQDKVKRENFRPVLSRYGQDTTKREEKLPILSQNDLTTAEREGKQPILSQNDLAMAIREKKQQYFSRNFSQSTKVSDSGHPDPAIIIRKFPGNSASPSLPLHLLATERLKRGRASGIFGLAALTHINIFAKFVRFIIYGYATAH